MQTMKVALMVLALLLAAVVVGFAGKSWGQAPASEGTPAGGGAARDIEVTKNPAALVAPGTRAADLAVYGVKLGDPVEKIPNAAGVSRQPTDRPDDALYTGRNVCYFAYAGRIYHIRVLGDIIKDLPPYDSTRLQIALGKADEVLTKAKIDDSRNMRDETRLGYFARRLQFTFFETPIVSAVDFYAP